MDETARGNSINRAAPTTDVFVVTGYGHASLRGGLGRGEGAEVARLTGREQPGGTRHQKRTRRRSERCELPVGRVGDTCKGLRIEFVIDSVLRLEERLEGV